MLHFLVHAGIALLGRPERHVSTGCHQTIGPHGRTAYDIMGWPREECARGKSACTRRR